MRKIWINKSKINNGLLFITGISGSGKSTLAYDFKRKYKNAQIIHLDLYYDYLEDNEVYMCKSFNEFLQAKLPEYFEIINNFDLYSKARFSSNYDDMNYIFYWKTMDRFIDLIKDFADIEQSLVIVEGIQLFDSTINNSKEYLKDQSLIIIQANPYQCAKRVIERDELPPYKITQTYSDRLKQNVQLNHFIDEMLNN
jgi:uridine kinase